MTAAPAIDMQGLREDFEHIGMVVAKGLDGRVAADVLAKAARFGGLEAQKTDIVEDFVAEGIVCVEATFVTRD